MATPDLAERHRLVDVRLDETVKVRRRPEVEHERRVAIFDLLEGNHFVLLAGPPGPYVLHLSMSGLTRLVITVHDEAEQLLARLILPLKSFSRLVRDYFQVCESYYTAIRTLPPSRIEALDMGRRGLHSEGAELLRDLLKERVEMDLNTARRLFTLICVLHVRG
ncbi:UPF0262 family protein [Roseospirillum parvum]|uniref:Uncharacterized protein, UPF0262 family n=1 Tax=Roseospirillum parvum TaxID=83401 RepID=A0A1G8BXS9_9PROT|nr:UPF0262 family protein [Roseospirillum parvum]SDH37520.1 Uncharacterized protein, UPF0262 family [Roseospirillum parvum]